MTENTSPKDNPKDICICGDFRYQHDETGCRVCLILPSPSDDCKAFRLAYRFTKR